LGAISANGCVLPRPSRRAGRNFGNHASTFAPKTRAGLLIVVNPEAATRLSLIALLNKAEKRCRMVQAEVDWARPARILVGCGAAIAAAGAFVLPWLTGRGSEGRFDLRAWRLFAVFRARGAQDGWSLLFGYGWFVAAAGLILAVYRVVSTLPIRRDEQMAVQLAAGAAVVWSVLALRQTSTLADLLEAASPTAPIALDVGLGAWAALVGSCLVFAGVRARLRPAVAG
jgi:hypothetical protein